MSTDGIGIQDDEELEEKLNRFLRVLKWIMLGAIIFLLYGTLIYGAP